MVRLQFEEAFNDMVENIDTLIDDKSHHCIPFVLARLELHNVRHAANPHPPPFFLGLNGVQGAGKTMLVNILRSALYELNDLPTLAFSLDDLYLTNADQRRLAAANPDNPLLQHRGQPSTHDIALGKQIFKSLKRGLPTKIPKYDKSAYDGQGERLPESEWEMVNDVANGQQRIQVVIFEGWCVGFRARPAEEIRAAWEDAVRKKAAGDYDGQLANVKLEHVMKLNEALKEYDVFTDQLDAFIHLDAEDTHYVYDWRQQQERTLRITSGRGMTPEQVTNFVNGYYPSYELFINNLRNGVFNPAGRHLLSTGSHSAMAWTGKQLRLVLNKRRRVVQVLMV